MSDQKQRMISLLHEIANRSLNGSIPWTQPTPSTFQWVQDKESGGFVVNIQRAISATSALRALAGANIYEDADYLFQIQETSPKRVLVSLSSKERPELGKVLADLYGSAERGIDQRTNAVIERLLRGDG